MVGNEATNQGLSHTRNKSMHDHDQIKSHFPFSGIVYLVPSSANAEGADIGVDRLHLKLQDRKSNHDRTLREDNQYPFFEGILASST